MGFGANGEERKEPRREYVISEALEGILCYVMYQTGNEPL
jgi:hypothetical protein